MALMCLYCDQRVKNARRIVGSKVRVSGSNDKYAMSTSDFKSADVLDCGSSSAPDISATDAAR